MEIISDEDFMKETTIEIFDADGHIFETAMEILQIAFIIEMIFLFPVLIGIC